MKVDYVRLINEIDLWPIIDRLNIETDYGIGNAYPKGATLGVKSPFRIDNTIGSCVINMRGRYKGLFTDWAENYHCNFVKYVSAVLNVPWWEAEEYILKDYGGREAYFIPGTESEYELEHGINKSTKIRQSNYSFPAMLSTSELKSIGLDEYQDKDNPINNYIIKSCSSTNITKKDLADNEYVLRLDVPNPAYKNDFEPEYLSFEDYINNRKNPNGSSEEPIHTIYCIGYKQRDCSLTNLYQTDKYIYYNLIRSKIKESIQELDLVIEKNSSTKKEDVETRAAAKSSKRILKKLLNKFKLEDKDYNACLKEHFELEHKEFLASCEGY